MSLDLTKLGRVVELGDGVKRARCPACAESGSDRSGQHLRIYPDGKFGCCVHPGDREHRKRIYALAGQCGPRGIRVRVAAAGPAQAVQSGILGRLEQAFQSPVRPDAADGLSEVESVIEQLNQARTQRTGEANSEIETANSGFQPRTARTGQTEWTEELFNDERTLRTPQYSLVLQSEPTEEDKNKTCIYKGFDGGVRGVREEVVPGIKLPYLTPSGDLVIPFSAPERYFWWKPPHEKRLRVREILAELRERKESDASPF